MVQKRLNIDERENEIFEMKVKEALSEYEKNPSNKKLSKKEFLEEISNW